MQDLISRQAAIDAIENTDWYHVAGGELVHGANSKEDEPLYKAEDIYSVIENLPSTQPEQTDCEYCHEDSDGYVKPIEKNCHAFIRFGMNGWELSLKANGWHGSAKIRYCPMCGRDLYVK